MLLALPSVLQGKLLDDHLWHAAALRGDAAWRFELLDGPAAQLRETGVLGWWAGDELQLSFMRPLASLSHTFDFRVWPEALWLMHLENVLLYAALILVVGWVLQRLFGPGRVAGLACLMFAIDELHATTVMWISARNTILAALFGVLALAAHIRWRAPKVGESRRWPFALAGPLCFALGLMSAEIGVAGLGYLLAYSLTRERGGWWARLAPLLPYLAITAVWRLSYIQMGFGAKASGLYIDPGQDPLGLLTALVLQTPALGFVALSLPVADALTTLVGPAWLGLPALGFVALAWVLAPLRDDPNARLLGLGMLAAALPLTLTAPTSRTMLMLSIGSAGLAAIAWERRYTPAFAGRLRRLGLGGLLVCQLVIAPLLFVPLSFAPLVIEPPHRALATMVPDDGRVVVVLNPPSEINALYPKAIRELDNETWPEHCYLLFAGLGAVSVERVDAHTLALETQHGWAASRVDQLSRDWSVRGFNPGDQIGLERAWAEVVAVGADQRPTQIRVHFDDDLDEVVVLGFDGATLTRWAPAEGERRVWTTSLTPALEGTSALEGNPPF
ncbi:putative membrane protein [Enhygromyxa salina]|uniref:Putative membrane protein n=1 Tax=Enhygromyxa salina TaxID=215803 RepID=A0A0C2DHJ2_9BACT|nr:putative membrane protein [Enhygromyxa salina]